VNRFIDWCADVLTAYVSGLVLGAPFGLLGWWLTGSRAVLTGAVVAAMVVLLVRRRWNRRARLTLRSDRMGVTAS